MLAIIMAGVLAAVRMARDVFPDLGVPTLYVAQPYGGMDPHQMEGFIVAITSTTSSTSAGSRARRIAQHSGRGADQAPVPSWHGHVAGVGRDGVVCKPCEGVYADGNGAAFCHAV